jgi:hypothetical protein
MKYVGKLTKSLWSNSHKAIHISNKYLKDTESMMNELNKMANNTSRSPLEVLFNKLFPNKKYEQKIDIDKLLKACNGDKEKLRQKLIKSKNAVLSFDFLFSTGSVAGMAFLNNAITKKKTNMDGYSAEFEMADRSVVEKRAEKFKKTEPLRKGIAASLIAMLAAFPFAIRKGLISPKDTGFSGYIKKVAKNFDYTSGIYMKRLPLFLFLTVGMTGVALASRNQTEVKNNLLINGAGLAGYFGGDLLINSILSKASDKILKTNIVDRSVPKTFLNKIITPTIPIKNLKGKSKNVAVVNFFITFAAVALLYGLGIPTLMNKITRNDISKAKNNSLPKRDFSSEIIKRDMESRTALRLT